MKGTHGTCRSRTDLIKNEGFNVSSTGKRGSGVYFWGYTLDSLEVHAKNLAVQWWFFSNKKGIYHEETDKRCSIIFVSFDVEPDKLLDLENQIVRDGLIEYYSKVHHKITSTGDEKLSIIYDMFVNDLETKISEKFKLVHVRIPQPNGFKTELPRDITGQPSCYVVKDTSCITIAHYEEYGDE